MGFTRLWLLHMKMLHPQNTGETRARALGFRAAERWRAAALRLSEEVSEDLGGGRKGLSSAWCWRLGVQRGAARAPCSSSSTGKEPDITLGSVLRVPPLKAHAIIDFPPRGGRGSLESAVGDVARDQMAAGGHLRSGNAV